MAQGGFYPPPPPFLGACQPHAPRTLAPSITAVPVNEPPYQHAGRTPVAIEVAWINQPDAAAPAYRFIGMRQPFEASKLAPGIPGQSIDQPPYQHPGRTPVEIEIAWLAQPDPWTYNIVSREPFEPRKLAPAITAVRVDEPPYQHPGRTPVEIEIAWLAQPDPWTYNIVSREPFEPRKLPPVVTAVQVDNPIPQLGGPLVYRHVLAWLAQPDPWTYNEAGRQPFEARKLAPGVPGQSVDQPPYSHPARLPVAIEVAWINQPGKWQPDPILPEYRFLGGRQPFEPKTLSPAIPGQSADPPPFELGGPFAIKAIIAAASNPDWSVNAWPYVFIGRSQPYGPAKDSPRLISVAVDEPPYQHPGRTANMNIIVAAWIPPPPTFELVLYEARPEPQPIRPTARGYIIL